MSCVTSIVWAQLLPIVCWLKKKIRLHSFDDADCWITSLKVPPKNDTWCILMTEGETVTVLNVIAIASLVSEIWLATELHTHTQTQTHRHSLGSTVNKKHKFYVFWQIVVMGDMMAQLVEHRPQDLLDSNSMTRGSNPIWRTRKMCEFFRVRILCFLVGVPHPRVYTHA